MMLNKIAGIFGFKVTRLDEDRFFGRSGAYLGANSSTVFSNTNDFVNAYTQISYVGQCAQKIADHIARMPWELKTARNKTSDNYIFESLIYNESGLSVEYKKIVLMSAINYCLDGNIFLLLDTRSVYSKQTKTPDCVIPINPACVDIYDENGVLVTSTSTNVGYKATRYMVRHGARCFEVMPDQIIHISNPGPFNCIRGMGIVQQNAAYLDVDRYRTLFEQSAMKQGARVPAVLLNEGERPLSQTQRDQIKTQFREEVYGYENSGTIPLIDGNFKLQNTNFDFREMEMLEKARFSREDIMAMFSIPPLVYGITSDVRYDSSQEQMRIFYDICAPRYTPAIESAFQCILNKIDSKLRFRLIAPRYYDRAQIKDAFDRGAITPNEYRLIIGLDPVPDDAFDKTYITMSLVPLDDLESLQDVEIEKPSSEPDDPEEAKKKIAVTNDLNITRDWQMRIHRRALRTKKRTMKNMMKEVSNYSKSLENRLLSLLEGGKTLPDDPTIDELWDDAAEYGELYSSGYKMHQSAVAIGVNDGNELWDVDIDGSILNPKIMLVVEKLAKKYADQTVNSRREELRNVMNLWRQSGQGIGDLKRSIQDMGSELYGAQAWKAQRIARTEAALAWDQANLLAYDQIGVRVFDIVGCIDNFTDCNKRGIPRDQVDNLRFHPNHTGTMVPHVE